jgi:UDP-N-acetylglucosamine diphosphorylase / glucose-1-phosphate thymidylyltransferase / UDP-N-acetylgalactosamine diphosphorylase / glucosamine-1-phosphate N-acetyltransferase / galactosamine-1-phosphate N-acetyltransferase
MNIVMPMAGRGRRFAEMGIDAPKPLIDVRGRPMYAWATESLPLELASRLIFICLQEHLLNRELADDIRSRYEPLRPEIIPLGEVTEGQACTVLKAAAWIDNDEPLLIYNADTYCRSALSKRLLDLPAHVAGLIGVFHAPGDKWSFARADAHGRVLEVTEKRRISEWASTGLYYFRRGRDFVEHARRMIGDNERSGGEFYVAPIYNRLIAAGAEILIDPAEEVWVLGTPEDLRHFHDHYNAN